MKIKKKNKSRLFYLFLFITSFLVSTFIFVNIRDRLSSTNPSSLFSGYQIILPDAGEPVSNPTIPTIEEVVSWLSIDNTDGILYVEDEWMCGDYSVMLVVNAKENSWRMRIVIMFYSYDGDEGYGKSALRGSLGHAFNLIYTQDGNDLDDELDVWYIEPQSDVVWNINYGHYEVYNYYSGGLAGTLWQSIFWVNYYDII
ncbi:hypothetical protein LCGC14_1131040 [marine sediment metagenome]|uniref:Uncharacterized protein n=1 Tax=marine sediment metagenome TaxID=412755 RepID=A0A0F9PJA4_9ZZZZ